jgi:hypothetical protein
MKASTANRPANNTISVFAIKVGSKYGIKLVRILWNVKLGRK